MFNVMSTATISLGILLMVAKSFDFKEFSSLYDLNNWIHNGDIFCDKRIKEVEKEIARKETKKRRRKSDKNDFKKFLLEKDEMYVDKSLLISKIIRDYPGVCVINRPKRWGKSLNLNMLGRFFATEVNAEGIPVPPTQNTNRKLFFGGKIYLDRERRNKTLKPLKISSMAEDCLHQGVHPVIFIDMGSLSGLSYEEIKKSLKKKVHRLFIRYDYVARNGERHGINRSQYEKYKSDDANNFNWTEALPFLSQSITKYFAQKPVILIDNYDSVLFDVYTTFGRYSSETVRLIRFFDDFYRCALHYNRWIWRGIVTGYLNVLSFRDTLRRSVCREYRLTMLNERAFEFFGFTEQEVDELLIKTRIQTNRTEIKRWYNGYKYDNLTLYNPYSIIKCLKNNGKVGHYWTEYTYCRLTDYMADLPEIYDELLMIVSENKVSNYIARQTSLDGHSFCTENGLRAILVHSGLITAKRSWSRYILSVPNEEAKLNLMNMWDIHYIDSEEKNIINKRRRLRNRY